MPKKTVRQSLSLPARIASDVRRMARARKTSANKIVVELIEAGLEFREVEKKRFFSLADRLAHTADPDERQRIKGELARMTFGD